MATTEQMDEIRKHGLNLLAIFPDATERDPVKLCKKLRKMEVKAHRLAEQHCNGDIGGNEWLNKSDAVLGRVICEILCIQEGELQKAIFINGDPRGYALKIDDAHMRANQNWTLDTMTERQAAYNALHRDWGGYGIIAPDLTA